MGQPNLRQLEVFSVMMETMSVSETARRLHVTQPAVSKTISTLEELVGLQLFKRVRGRILPSTDAERLNAEVDRVFAQMDALTGSIVGLRSARAGRLTVVAVPAMAASLIGLCAGQFLKERPRVRLSLLARMSPQAVEDVSRHRAELAFIHGPPSDPDVDGVVVGESEFVCAMQSTHALAGMQTLTPQDLRNESLIFLDAASPPSVLVRDKFSQAGVVPKVVLETNMSFAARTALMNNNSIAVIDSLFSMTDRRDDIVVRPFRPRVPLQIYCLYSAHRPLSPLAQRFIDDVRERIAAARAETSEIGWS